MPRKKTVPIIILAVLLLTMTEFSGCTNQNNDGTNLTPARDVTGNWTGSPVFTDRAYECAYEGTMKLRLEQQDSNVTGYFDLTVVSTDGSPACVQIGSTFRYLVEGTISSSRIDLLVAGTDALVGSFTTDLMTLRWEQCQECDSGPAIKLVGMVSLRKER